MSALDQDAVLEGAERERSADGDGTPSSVRVAHMLGVARMETLLADQLHAVSRQALVDTTEGSVRLGVDVVDVGRLTRELGSAIGATFARRVFTATEIADCGDQVSKYATRWAVKEAVSKAIGTGFRQGLHASHIEVITASDGSIRVAPTAGHRWPHDADAWAWTVSASHEGNLGLAVAIALR